MVPNSSILTKSILDVAQMEVFSRSLATERTAQRSQQEELDRAKKTSNIEKSVKYLSDLISRSFSDIEYPFPPQKSLFATIHRQYDENLHSDYVAALLNKNYSNDLACEIFSRIAKFAGLTEVSTASLSVRREVHLRKISPKLYRSELGDRRIDLLIESQDTVLVIENKVLSNESTNQTSDYWTALKVYSETTKKTKIGALLLSPNRQVAESPNFAPISYSDLYRILCSEKAKDHSLANLYRNEIFEIFVKPFLKFGQKVT